MQEDTKSSGITKADREALLCDKYDSNRSADLSEDLARLAKGEPLAYVIGWIPFLGLRLFLDSHPLIPRPETEWWTETLIEHLKETYGEREFKLLDLCAGSGAIGLAVARALPYAHVSFGELDSRHVDLIRKNAKENGIALERLDICESDLFGSFSDNTFDVIASNPPYIPSTRALPESVALFEPEDALYAGKDGLDLIRRIVSSSATHMREGGELWMEADVDNIDSAKELFIRQSARSAEIRTDLYGRPRIVVAYYS